MAEQEMFHAKHPSTEESPVPLPAVPVIEVQKLIAQIHIVAKDADGMLKRGQFVGARAAIAAMSMPIQALADLFSVKL